MIKKFYNQLYGNIATTIFTIVRFISRIIIKRKNHPEYNLYESDNNCGYLNERMTERGLELMLVKDILDNWEAQQLDIIEVGAVTPYYFRGRIKDVLDPADSHPLVNLKIDLFDYDFTEKSVVSISTIEHVGTGDFSVEKRGDSVHALVKIIKESEHCFITCPIGYNKRLDRYCLEKRIPGMTCYKRGYLDNNWQIVEKAEAFKTKYIRGLWASAIFVIEK